VSSHVHEEKYGEYHFWYWCGCDEIKIAPPPPGDLNLQEMNMSYETKDSGQRQEFSTGMVRDVQTDKPRYDLLDMPMLTRWAELMARGAKKYGENNWKKAATQEELERFKASAMRHLFQWFNGDVSEDHAAAVCFNLAGAEMAKAKIAIKMNTDMSENFKEGTHVGTVKVSNIRMPDIRQG
jgi:hypothetical protein